MNKLEAARTQADLPTVHCTELPPAQSDSLLRVEWDFYRSQVLRLLADGHEGRTVLVKGEEIVGVFDTMEEARTAGYEKFLRQPFLIHQVQEREPLIRVSPRFWGCRG